MSHIEIAESGCWLWTGFTDRGYGYFSMGTYQMRPHRFAYQWFVGELPRELTIDHLCRVRNCVNPDHLEAVPIQVNLKRGFSFSAINGAKTQCKFGHPFDAENTAILTGPIKGRVCKTCSRHRAREWYRANQSVAARAQLCN